MDKLFETIVLTIIIYFILWFWCYKNRQEIRSKTLDRYYVTHVPNFVLVPLFIVIYLSNSVDKKQTKSADVSSNSYLNKYSMHHGLADF